MVKPKLEALPFTEAIKHFRSKGYKETFDWQEIMGDEHVKAFTVAKATQRDILQDIRGAVDKSLAEGTTFETFKKNLKPVLQEKGWWGRKEMTDPATGEVREVQLGSSRRLKTIYETNMRTSYAAGRWEQIERTKEFFPYLRYVSVMDGRERPEHRALHNTVLPIDHPFWNDHYPPNGWGCRCTADPVAEEDLKHLGLSVTAHDPSLPPRHVRNTRTGELMTVPQGIDPGFNYNVGQSWMKSLTPPPLDKPLAVPFAGNKKDAPPPSPVTPPLGDERLDKMPDAEAVAEGLKIFGATLKKPKVFIDAVGEPMVIGKDLFTNANGSWKVGRGRKKYIPLLMRAIKEPDEIWRYWDHSHPQGPRLRKRYFLRATDGKNAFVAFDYGKDGWTGATAFPVDGKKYFEDQRVGTLVYRRPDDKTKK